MSETGHNEQFDDDIMQSRADILRARDIIPRPLEQNKKSQSPPPPTGQQTKSQKTEQKKNGIPRFDLAEEIMAEQRKITAIKRKPPLSSWENKMEDKKIVPPLSSKGQAGGEQEQKPKAGSIGYCLEQQRPISPEQKQIIAEIVARDIKKLRRGDTLLKLTERSV